MFPNRVPMEGGASSPEPMVYLFIFIRRNPPVKEPYHEKRGKQTDTVHGAHADGRLTYNGVRPGSPRGSFATLQSLTQCHADFSTIPSTLHRVGQRPVSQRVL